MARLVLTVGGQVAGFALGGPIGAAIGGAIGGYAASLLEPKPPDQYGPRFDDAQITSSAYGQTMPIVWGTMPVPGNIIDASPITAVKKRVRSGGKGSPSTPKTYTFTHYVDLAVLVADASLHSYDLIQIYANKRLIYDATPTAAIQQPEWLQFEWYDGTQTDPDPTFVTVNGAGEQPVYADKCYIVFNRFKLDEFGLADQIAIQFDFVIASNGSRGPSEETLDTTTIESTSNDILDIAWLRYPDLVLVGVSTTAASNVATNNLMAVNPYTRQVVWSRSYPDAQHDARCRNLTSCSIPIYYLGVQINVPHAQVAYTIDHGSTNTVYIEVADAETGAIRTRGVLASSSGDDTYQPYWMIAPYGNEMTLYRHLQTGAGSGGAYRMNWTGQNYSATSLTAPWSSTAISNPTGYSLAASVEPASSGDGKILFTFVDGTPGPPAYIVIDDRDFATDAASLSFDAYTPIVLSDCDSVVKCCYDATLDCFWVLGDRSADAHMQLYRIETDGTQTDDWNVATEIGITGTATFGDLQLGIDSVRGRIIIGMNSYYYAINTADPTVDLEAYAQPSVGTAVGGEMHPLTGRWYTKNDEVLHIVKLDGATSTGVDLETVCEGISLDGSTHLVSTDVDYSGFAARNVRGFKISRSMAKKAALGALAQAYLFDIVPRSGVLTGVLRGSQSSAATLDQDQIGAYIDGGQPPCPLTISKTPPEGLPRQVEIRFINEAQNWDPGAQTYRRAASPDGIGTTEAIDLALSMTDTEARQLAEVTCHMRHVESERYQTQVVPSLVSTVVPAAVVTVDYDSNTYVGRIETAPIVDGMIVDATLARYDASIYTSSAVGGTPRNTEQTVYAIGSTVTIPMKLPAMRSEDFDAGYYVAVYSRTPTWPGADIFRSTDNATYSSVAASPNSSTVCRVASIAAGIRPIVWDTQSQIVVNVLTGDSLASEALADLESDATVQWFAVGADGRWVVGRYLTATDNSDGTWTISDFVLGLQGTEQYVDDLAANDRLVLLTTDTISRVVLPSSEIGGTDYIKGVTIGRSVTDVAPVAVVPSGRALRPFAPHATHAEWSGSDITLSWARRDKEGTRAFWEAPMTEQAESYTVNILNSDYDTVRTLTSSTESVTYTSAQQAADFGAAIAYVRWEVAQVSSVVGAGFYARTESGKKVSWENYILALSPVVFIRFEEAVGSTTLADYSGNGYDLTHPDSYSILRQTGAFDYAMDLSEAGTFGETLDFGTVAALNNLNNGDFSVGIWIQPKTGWTAGNLGNLWNSISGFDMYFTDAGGGVPQLLTVVTYATTTARFYTTDFTLSAGTWHLIVCTHDTATKTSKIYFDGAEVGSYTTSTTGAGAAVNGSGATKVGSLQTTDILIDELFALNTELSSAQVAAIYAKRTE